MITGVSLCVIIKNSEDVLKPFFQWAVDSFSDICVVVDPENSDDTLKLVHMYAEMASGGFEPGPIRVLEHPFDNFSSQWTRSFELAKSDWIFYVGSDEILVPCNMDGHVRALQRLNKKVGIFQRYNLQGSLHSALEIGYPDYQYRLFNKHEVSMDGKEVDESLSCRNSFIIFPEHIIHLGHIRPSSALIQKGKDRLKFKDVDDCDGEGLRLHGEKWFEQRNLLFNSTTFKIEDPEVLDTISKYIPSDFIK